MATQNGTCVRGNGAPTEEVVIRRNSTSNDVDVTSDGNNNRDDDEEEQFVPPPLSWYENSVESSSAMAAASGSAATFATASSLDDSIKDPLGVSNRGDDDNDDEARTRNELAERQNHDDGKTEANIDTRFPMTTNHDSNDNDNASGTPSSSNPHQVQINDRGNQERILYDVFSHPMQNQPLSANQQATHHTLVYPLNTQHPETSRMMTAVGSTQPSPGWKEISKVYLPLAARELLSSSIRRICYTARVSYAKGHWYRKYSDMGNKMGGFLLRPSGSGNGNGSGIALTNDDAIDDDVVARRLRDLPPISSLPWIDRQLVKEWRTYMPDTASSSASSSSAVPPPPGSSAASRRDFSAGSNFTLAGDDADSDFEQARSLVPNPVQRPKWQKAECCFACRKSFGPTRLRHHCRLCGNSFCHADSSTTHSLPHLGYDPDVKERVCDACKRLLEEQNLAERVAWRLARCRDYESGDLTPYFELGIDSYEQVAIRVTKAAIAMAKTIPLGAQATVAVETVDVLRKYGLNGIYGLMLRQEFLAAADLLRRALGINKTSWPLSVHELSAAIFYALAQHRAIRGLNPEREHMIHAYRTKSKQSNRHPSIALKSSNLVGSVENVEYATESQVQVQVQDHQQQEDQSTSIHKDESFSDVSAAAMSSPDIVQTCYSATRKALEKSLPNPSSSNSKPGGQPSPKIEPVCDPVSDPMVNSLLMYAPIALNFIYATREVDMQLLAAQQGWLLLYSHLQQDTGDDGKLNDRPASAVFVHRDHKIACLAIRGTATISDVITDIRQTPVPFPENDAENSENNESNQDIGDWTNISSAQGIALCGMATAATNLYREHIDAIVALAKQGYRIRITGHSLGGGVAAMVAVLILRHLRREVGELFETTTAQPTNESSTMLRVYGYGTPSCVDAKLAESMSPYVTTVVLHDDVFPRLTPATCRRLLKHLLHIRETWVKRHMATDLKAIGDRAKTAWAPRFRQSFTLAAAPARSIKQYYRKHFRKSSSHQRKGGDQNHRHHQEQDQQNDQDEHFVDTMEQAPMAGDETYDDDAFQSSGGNSNNGDDDDDGNQYECDQNGGNPKPGMDHLLDFLGGANGEVDGVVIDGDEFFDTEADDLIEHSDDDYADSYSKTTNSVGIDVSDCTVTTDASNAMHGTDSLLSDGWSVNNTLDQQQAEAPSSDDQQTNPDASQPNGGGGGNDKQHEDANDASDSPNAVVLEETPLPRMFVPGKVVHIYSHRGVYKAAYVPRSFRELRRISLAGNMLSDHTAKAYYEGLLEVQSARTAMERPPRWTPFDEDDTCSCCASRFTWASTSSSAAQEARDKHNCRSCGGLVCDPCSKNRVPMPSIGITAMVRVCDRCYNDINGTNSSRGSTRTLVNVEDDVGLSDSMISPEEQHAAETSGSPDTSPRPERKRDKRSLVVDELASRIRSSALTSC
eukprot:CAMPEP_0119560048 /NCGR_PEP_ID=MMETSP1352-20130426/13861_1 /TAXON_ID=265584 /ORGANISM="Stauroneis constricta, Strain CCMP1120" /LENGTH=1432 /DNA_ID=CAMNT_0007607917 /DNA_START=66 /DNA_END=4364 /DNA_ORIENTATION=+